MISGPSGCGKSCLGLNVALSLGRRYYEYVVTARSEARDLLWTFDSLRRLNDAQAKKIKDDKSYVEPGPLWWAFDAESAQRQDVKDPSTVDGNEAVVLIDEIDKADPDLPNNLLIALGSFQFTVTPTGVTVTGQPERQPLIFITTNQELELPRAFVRRCVVLDLPSPTVDELVEIAGAVLPEKDYDKDLFYKVAKLAVEPAKDDEDDDGGVSTAEYLDTLRACVELEIGVDHESFEKLTQITLRKDVAGDETWV